MLTCAQIQRRSHSEARVVRLDRDDAQDGIRRVRGNRQGRETCPCKNQRLGGGAKVIANAPNVRHNHAPSRNVEVAVLVVGRQAVRECCNIHSRRRHYYPA